MCSVWIIWNASRSPLSSAFSYLNLCCCCYWCFDCHSLHLPRCSSVVLPPAAFALGCSCTGRARPPLGRSHIITRPGLYQQLKPTGMHHVRVCVCVRPCVRVCVRVCARVLANERASQKDECRSRRTDNLIVMPLIPRWPDRSRNRHHFHCSSTKSQLAELIIWLFGSRICNLVC